MKQAADETGLKALVQGAASLAQLAGLPVPDLRMSLVSHEEKAAHRAEVARLAREYNAQQAMMDRYMDSRDTAADRHSNARVQSEDRQRPNPFALTTKAPD